MWCTDFLKNCNFRRQRKLKDSYLWMSKYSRFDIEYCFYNISDHLKYFWKHKYLCHLTLKHSYYWSSNILYWYWILSPASTTIWAISTVVCAPIEYCNIYASDIHLFVEKVKLNMLLPSAYVTFLWISFLPFCINCEF